MTQQTRLKIIGLLQQHVRPRLFSLSSYVQERLTRVEKTKFGFSREERGLLEQLNFAKSEVELLNYEGAAQDEVEAAYKWFDGAFFGVREFYLKHHARGVVCTASMACNILMRYYNPVTIIIEEASQVTEALAVAVISRNIGSARKVVLVGDIKQNRPFTLEDLSEFAATTRTSLMERLIRTGVPVTELREQYRMHPDISVTVSRYFYNNGLPDSPSVANRPADAIWARFKELAFREQALHHSYFVHTSCTHTYRSKTKRSLMNPAHLFYVPHLINKLRQAGAADSQIAYLTTYRG